MEKVKRIQESFLPTNCNLVESTIIGLRQQIGRRLQHGDLDTRTDAIKPNPSDILEDKFRALESIIQRDCGFLQRIQGNQAGHPIESANSHQVA